MMIGYIRRDLATTIRLLLATVVVVLGVVALRTMSASALYSTATIQANLANGVSTAYGWDSGCRSAIGVSRGLTFNNGLRARIDQTSPPASYVLSTWISAKGQPNTTNPVNVAYGTTTVPMQFNSVNFLCRTLIAPDLSRGCTDLSVSAYDIYRSGGWVTPTNAADAYPNAEWAPNGGCMNPAKTGVAIQLSNLTAQSSGGAQGVVSGFTNGSILDIGRNNTSRYWFSNKTYFNYYDANGLTQDQTVTFKADYKNISTYYGSTYICSGVTVSGPHSFGSCPIKHTTFTIYIHVGPPPCPAGETGTPPNCKKPSVCPGDPNIQANALVTVPTPYNTPDPQTAPTGTTTTQGATYTQDIPVKNGNFTVADTSTGGTPVSPASLNLQVAADQQSAIVDYTIFTKTYPYDHNQASVSYYTYYRTQTWKATKSNGNGTYSYVQAGGLSGQTQNYNTAVGYTMSPCYKRSFTASWDPQPTSGTLDNAEDPTSANFTGNTVNVHFYGPVDPKNLRLPSVVTLTYSGSGPYGSCNGGTLTITSPNNSASDNTGSFNLSCPVSAPPLEVGQQVCINMTVTPQAGDVDDAGNMSNTSGSLTANPCTNALIDEPYTHFFGEDVSTGGDFANGNDLCAGENPTQGGQILTWLEDAARGSGAQFAAISGGNRGSVNQFSTANLRGANPIAPNGLLLPNNPPNGSLGTSACIPDYYGSRPNSLTAWPGTPAAGQTKAYILNGNTLGGFSVPLGTSVAIYASGSVTVTGNITYAGAGGGWTVNGNQSNVPSLFVIAKGNISAAPNVTELDGTYVAQGGTFDSCSTHDYTSCNSQLVVYGSVIAKQLNLFRTYSSLRDSKPGEYPNPLGNTGNCDVGDNGNPTGPGGARPTNYDCAAEIFIFSPETYLPRPAIPPFSNSQQYDAIFSLSPVL